MAIGSLFRKMLGASDKAPEKAQAVDYNGFQIYAQPKRQGGQFITAGTIEKTIDGEPKQHVFIRADTHTSFDDASSHSVRKAQQIIDEQGDHIFD